MRYYIALFSLIAILGIPWVALNYPIQVDGAISKALQWSGNQQAAIVAHNAQTVLALQSKYAAGSLVGAPKIRILIVPGHEPNYGGAEFGSLKERDLAVDLADDLAAYLRKDPAYQVFLTRDKQEWMPAFADYFRTQWASIIDWEKSYSTEMSHLISIGATSKPTSTVYHNKAPEDVALRLFGITKWANENSIDLMIHVHFNDAPDHKPGTVGDHSGFAIYVPSAQYDNSTSTHAIADTVFKRLSKYSPVSDLKGESGGIVDEPELIAVGVNNTSDAASMLIEYGYLYEPQFANAEVRSTSLNDLAYQTYLGVRDFFEKESATGNIDADGTAVLPYTWNGPIPGGEAITPDAFALQTALIEDGDYPPQGKTMNDCPRTGKIGACTKAALDQFQAKYGITGEKGVVGPKTIDMLNEKFGVKVI